MSHSLPLEFRATADGLRTGLSKVLHANLVGVYVYGSALDPSFVPGRSDLDCIVVTAEAIDSVALRRLEVWLRDAVVDDPELLRIQISFLVRDRVLQDDPTACLFQFGKLTRSGSDGNPIIWLDFLTRGLVLVGPHPSEFLPDIHPDELQAALVREVGYLREEISTKSESEWRGRSSYQAYVVLTLCRILYSKATGGIASKVQAAEWAIHNTPGEEQFHDLIRVAEGVSNESFIARIQLPLIERFIDHVERIISA